MTTPEAKVKAKLNKRLAKYTKVYRYMPVSNGMGAPSLDYLLCCNSRFVAVETKVLGKTLTPRQHATAAAMRAAGAYVRVVDGDESLDILCNLLEFLGCEKK